jgi:hypothetical protein
MPKILLSYRRQDSAGVAGRIYDRLRTHFGNDAIFIDLDSIPFGVDFREHITSAVDQCGVMLALIGHNWAGGTGASRRIDDARDFVRIEIESALERNLPVISILIDRAQMPGEADLPPSLVPLAYRNAIDLDQGRDFHHHVARLIKGIEFSLASRKPCAPGSTPQACAAIRTNPGTFAPGSTPQARAPITKSSDTFAAAVARVDKLDWRQIGPRRAGRVPDGHLQRRN